METKTQKNAGLSKQEQEQILALKENGLTNEDIKAYKNQGFDYDQMLEIFTGLRHLTQEQVAFYAKPEIHADQMRAIINGFANGLSQEQMEPYVKQGFFGEHLDQIFGGFINGLEQEQVDLYAKWDYDDDQMYEIRMGFQEGLTMEQMKQYADPNLDSDAMAAIRRDLLEKAKENEDIEK